MYPLIGNWKIADAWVTLATNDSYSLGALVLAHSLKRAGTAHQLAVLITPGVSNAMRCVPINQFPQDQPILILLLPLSCSFSSLHRRRFSSVRLDSLGSDSKMFSMWSRRWMSSTHKTVLIWRSSPAPNWASHSPSCTAGA